MSPRTTPLGSHIFWALRIMNCMLFTFENSSTNVLVGISGVAFTIDEQLQ